MKVGLDAFTIREVTTDPFGQLKFAYQHGFDGVQFDEASYLGTDVGRLKDIVQYAEENGLYTHASVDVINPVTQGQDSISKIAKEIAAYAQVGWNELRTRTGGLDERGPQYRAGAVEAMKTLRPVLKEYHSRINFENHGECTTFDLLRMIEEVGDDIMGINLDTANTFVHAEDPLLAVKRTAPYVHTTHAKDGILFFSKEGITRQGRPAGSGIVEWEAILPILYQHNKDLTLSIEDHKWLFEISIYNEQWMVDHPDLNPIELAKLVQHSWNCSDQILKGIIQDPYEYEKVSFADEMMERLNSARDYLKMMVKKLKAEEI